jgi:hypothetical protein
MPFPVYLLFEELALDRFGPKIRLTYQTPKLFREYAKSPHTHKLKKKKKKKKKKKEKKKEEKKRRRRRRIKERREEISCKYLHRGSDLFISNVKVHA